MTVIKHDFHKNQQPSPPTENTKKKIPGYQLRIDLGFSSPLIWRSVKVPGTITLADFHSIIQTCFGWDDEATHRFLVGKIFYSPSVIAKDSNSFSEDDYQLHELEEGMGFIFTYLYEGGSGWECEITLEEKFPDSKSIPSPELIAAERAFPSEIFDDIHEYQSVLQMIENSENPSTILAQHNLTKDFDPAYCDVTSINATLKALL
jgi:hypothetical protein